MKRWWLVLMVLLTPVWAQEEEPIVLEQPEQEEDLPQPGPLLLPQRSEEDWEAMKKGELIPGSALMGGIALEQLFSNTDERIELDEEVLKILKEEPKDDSWPVEIDEAFAGTYFKKPATAFLIDPQGLLTEQEFRDREGFLSYHGEESVIDLYVYLFEGKQDIPAKESPHSVLRNFFSNFGDVAVTFYHLGRPDRAQIAYSARINRGVSTEEREQALQLAKEAAGEKSESSSQLESFLLEMSGRLYHMEKKLPPERLPTDILAELELGNVEKNPSLFEKIPEAVKTLFATVVFLGFLVGVGFLARWITEERRIYEFPEAEGSPILEAPHAAGVGGILSYASAAQPPSLQKKQLADYLQRL